MQLFNNYVHPIARMGPPRYISPGTITPAKKGPRSQRDTSLVFPNHILKMMDSSGVEAE